MCLDSSIPGLIQSLDQWPIPRGLVTLPGVMKAPTCLYVSPTAQSPALFWKWSTSPFAWCGFMNTVSQSNLFKLTWNHLEGHMASVTVLLSPLIFIAMATHWWEREGLSLNYIKMFHICVQFSDPAVWPLVLLGCYEPAAESCPELWEGVPSCWQWPFTGARVTQTPLGCQPLEMAGHGQGKVQNSEKEEKVQASPKDTYAVWGQRFLQGNLRVWRGFHHLKCGKHRNGKQEPHTHIGKEWSK